MEWAMKGAHLFLAGAVSMFLVLSIAFGVLHLTTCGHATLSGPYRIVLVGLPGETTPIVVKGK